MSDTLEPQIIDYYNDEPIGAKIIQKLNEEFSELQSEMEELKKEHQKELLMYRNFYDEHRNLRLPPISEDNKRLFETFLVNKLDYIGGNPDGINSDVLIQLIESANRVSYVYHPDMNPQSEYNHLYSIIRKLNELTGEQNESACQEYIMRKMGDIAIQHMNWICDNETIISEFMNFPE